VLIYATHHALAKGALFLGVGPAHAARSRKQRLVAGAGLLLPALALAGAPFTSGALAKTALKANVGFLPEPWATALGVLLPLAAAGTTLKMVRFLWLAWPRTNPAAAESARGLWSPWLGLVTATLAGVWLLPGALELLPQKLSPEKLWDALWPLLFGGALALLGAWLRRLSSGDLSRWLPPGDVGVLIERLLARLELRVPVEAGSPHGQGHSHDPSHAQQKCPWYMPLKRAGELLTRLETRLSSWPVAGALWLLLMAVLVGLLAASHH